MYTNLSDENILAAAKRPWKVQQWQYFVFHYPIYGLKIILLLSSLSDSRNYVDNKDLTKTNNRRLCSTNTTHCFWFNRKQDEKVGPQPRQAPTSFTSSHYQMVVLIDPGGGANWPRGWCFLTQGVVLINPEGRARLVLGDGAITSPFQV